MKTKKNEDFILVGHLQVLDEALSSLYSDRNSGQFFLFVRVYEDEDDNTFGHSCKYPWLIFVV